MTVDRAVELVPITPAEVGVVAEFLHENLNSRVSTSAWTSAVVPPWKVDSPNHGFMLRDGERVVGVHLAFYAHREVGGQIEQFCNLAAWCVHEDFRAHSVRLLRALLGQRGYHFTDLSPSGRVGPLNLRLGFQPLDTSTALVPNLPTMRRPGGVRIVTDPPSIGGLLTGPDLAIYLDHADAVAAGHLVLTRGEETCYVMFRRDRRKGLPLFASILYVGEPQLFRVGFSAVRGHLLRQGALATLTELRVVGARPAHSVMLKAPRAKMFKSPSLRADQIDYLYSELACVAW